MEALCGAATDPTVVRLIVAGVIIGVGRAAVEQRIQAEANQRRKEAMQGLGEFFTVGAIYIKHHKAS